jgi:hypothetical protein
MSCTLRRVGIDMRSARWLRGLARIGLLASAMWLMRTDVAAQDDSPIFAGALFGVSTLSGDARSTTSGSDAALSMYEPKNGPALNAFAGVHLGQYFSLQANWMWNRNDVTLVSSFITPHDGGYYEQRRRSRQHAVVLDGLIYFRRLDSAVRPYLGTGLSLLRFSSPDVSNSSVHGLDPPTGAIASTHVGLRSHVGIDIRVSRRLAFRYSFSETISGNPISPSLTPPAPRRLANFQNLFGFVARP